MTPLILGVNRTYEFFMLTPYTCNLHRAEFMHSFVRGLNCYFKGIRKCPAIASNISPDSSFLQVFLAQRVPVINFQE